MKFVLFMISVFSTTFAFRTCPSSCTTSFYHSLYSILGTRQVNALRAPFHEIMRTEEDAQILYRKAKWTCFSVTRLDSCLKQCPSSFQKSAILSSLAHFNDYCALLRKPTRAVMNYFTCEREHLRKVQQNCEEVSVSYASNFNEICRILENYRKCYTTQQHNCSADALEIKERMDDSLMKTFETLLKMNANHFKIPSKCSIGLRRHRLRHFEYEDEEDDDDNVDVDQDNEENIENTHNSEYAPNSKALETRNSRNEENIMLPTTKSSSNTMETRNSLTNIHDILENESNVKKKHSIEYPHKDEDEDENENERLDEDENEQLDEIDDFGTQSPHLSPRPRWIGDVPSTLSIETTTHQQVIIHREMSPISGIIDNLSAVYQLPIYFLTITITNFALL